MTTSFRASTGRATQAMAQLRLEAKHSRLDMSREERLANQAKWTQDRHDKAMKEKAEWMAQKAARKAVK